MSKPGNSQQPVFGDKCLFEGDSADFLECLIANEMISEHTRHSVNIFISKRPSISRDSCSDNSNEHVFLVSPEISK